MYNKTMSNTLRKDQRGLVSFMITLIMMLVISLIVIGFTQVTNRNRREQLDRQLSSQAFYAAESGVNSAVAKINADNAAGGVVSQSSCAGTNYSATNLVSDGSVGFTCVLVNPIVPEIKLPVTTSSSAVAPLNLTDKDGNAITPAPATPIVFSFTWPVSVGGNTDPTNCSTSGSFPRTQAPVDASATNCGYALLRVDIMKVPGTINQPNLSGNTTTYYMQPRPSASAPTPISDFSTKAHVTSAACSNATKMCTGTISLQGAAVSLPLKYYVRITSFYRDTQVTVDATSTSIGGGIYFSGAQAIVDVTGKAVDVLRRVQVTVPLQKSTEFIPEGAVRSSSDVCKRFSTYPGYFSPANGCSAL